MNSNHNNGRNNSRNRGGGNNGNQQTACRHCGRNNHASDSCWSRPNNQNNRVQRYNNNNHNNNNRQGIRLPCIRCGLFGHDTKDCMAQELPLEEQCECSNEYHYTHQCPWERDPLAREIADGQAKGLICRWCKDNGEGDHDYTSCRAVLRFRAELLKMIYSQYDHLPFCWHCSADNHRTRACDKPVAEVDRDKWKSLVTGIIADWTKKDVPCFAGQYMDSEDAIIAGQDSRAPISTNYQWCFLCNNFGHTLSASCDVEEYRRRCPPSYRNKEVCTKRPTYPPPPYTYTPLNQSAYPHCRTCPPRPGDSHSLTSPLQNQGTIMRICTNTHCTAVIKFLENPGPHGEAVQCSKCRTFNVSPMTKQNNLQIDSHLGSSLKALAQLKDTGILDLLTGNKGKNDADIARIEQDPYLDLGHRPSALLKKGHLLIGWPSQQPRYTDQNIIVPTTGKPLYAANGEDIFNEPGNAQTYFPPIIFKASKGDLEIQDQAKHPINMGGHLGMTLQCRVCKCDSVVIDDEADIVMAGTTKANTLGLGIGTPLFLQTAHPTKCRCLIINGGNPELEWT